MVCCFLSHARLSQTPCRLVSGYLRPGWTEEALGRGGEDDNGADRLTLRQRIDRPFQFLSVPFPQHCGIHFGDEDECQRIRTTAKAPATRRCLSIPQSGGRT